MRDDLDLSELAVFVEVARHGGFSRAARALGLPRSTVSRKISDLEARLGARLFQRTTRRVQLTFAGRELAARAPRIVDEVDNARRAIADLTSAPRGAVRMTAPIALSAVGSLVADYLARYPDVDVELVCTDRRVDLVEERFDVALRAGASPDSTLVSRRVGAVRRVLVAAPKVAAGLRRATSLDELSRRPCVAFAPEGATWELARDGRRRAVQVRPRLVANDYQVLHEVARAGLGVALLPEHLCADDLRDGRLVAVLPSWSAPEVPLFALWPSSRHASPALVALVEHLARALAVSGAGRGLSQKSRQ